MALGYLGSWLYNDRHLTLACFAINVYFPASHPGDHLAAGAFYGAAVRIIQFLAHFYSYQ